MTATSIKTAAWRLRSKVFSPSADPRTYCWLGLGFALLYWISRISTEHLERLWINSDSLYPVNLIVDVFRDGYPLRGWRFSAAGFWFPEVLLAGIGFLVTRNVVIATLLAGALQFVLLIGAFQLCWRVLKPRNYLLLEVATLASAVAITLLVALHQGELYVRYCAFFVLSLHVGNLLMIMYAFDFALLFAMEGRRFGVPYVLVCFLGGLSNLLFIVHFAAPITFALIVSATAAALSWKQVRTAILFAWTPSLLGAVSAKLLFNVSPLGQASVGFGHVKIATEVFYNGAKTYLLNGDFSHIVACAWIVLSLVVAGQCFYRRSCLRIGIFLLFAAGASVLSAAAVMLTGISSLVLLKDYYWTMHYLNPMFLIPLFAWPVFLEWCRAGVRSLSWLSAALCLSVPLWLLARTPRMHADLWAYRPPLVQYLDALSHHVDLKYGYAGYWQARLITLLSSRGLRAYQVTPDLRPLLWENNVAWYEQSIENRGKPPLISFVVLKDPAASIPKATAVETFGEPARETSFEGIPILIYPHGVPLNPTVSIDCDQPLPSFEQLITSTKKHLDLRPAQTIEVSVTVKNTSSSNWSSTGRAPVALSYRWFAGGVMLPMDGVRTLLPKPLRPGATLDVNMKIEAPVEGHDLILRVSLVQEGVAWFMSKGGKSLDLPVTLR
jgi:hypothetical protein